MTIPGAIRFGLSEKTLSKIQRGLDGDKKQLATTLNEAMADRFEAILTAGQTMREESMAQAEHLFGLAQAEAEKPDDEADEEAIDALQGQAEELLESAAEQEAMIHDALNGLIESEVSSEDMLKAVITTINAFADFYPKNELQEAELSTTILQRLQYLRSIQPDAPGASTDEGDDQDSRHGTYL